jgi:probable rRNA maturation factor
MTGYRVNIDFDIDPIGVDPGALGDLLTRILAAEDVPDDTGIGVLITNDEAMQSYNSRFRGMDAPTDVLSFELDDDGDFAADESRELGDIVISLERALLQSVEHGWTVQQEVEHLAVHATLHLCGHDHEQGPEAEKAMQQREELYLGPLGNVHS